MSTSLAFPEALAHLGPGPPTSVPLPAESQGKGGRTTPWGAQGRLACSNVSRKRAGPGPPPCCSNTTYRECGWPDRKINLDTGPWWAKVPGREPARTVHRQTERPGHSGDTGLSSVGLMSLHR